MHVHPIHEEYWKIIRFDEYVSFISDLVARDKKSPKSLFPWDVTALAETFHEVLFPRQIPSQCLTPLVVRPYVHGIAGITV